MIALTAGMKFSQSNGAPFFDGMSCWFENVGSQIPHRIHNQTAFTGDILLVFTTRFMNTDYSKKVEQNLKFQTFCFQLQRARNINQCKSGMRLCSRFYLHKESKSDSSLQSSFALDLYPSKEMILYPDSELCFTRFISEQRTEIWPLVQVLNTLYLSEVQF